MKKRIIKFFDKIHILILGLLGICYGCPKYGMPEAKYEIKGVVNERGKDYRHIKHIQITAQTKRNHYWQDTLYTNSRGEYDYQFVDFPLAEPLYLKFEDIDGAENWGDFETQEMEVVFTDDDCIKKGKGAWDKGTFAKTINIELSPKE